MLEALKQIVAPTTLGETSIERVLAFARAHLGMDLAWISRAGQDVQTVEYIDGATELFGVGLGTTLPSFSGASRRGHAYVVAPLLLPDGRVYGHLACVSQHLGPTPNVRDEQFLEFVAALLGPSVAALDADRERRARQGARVQLLLDAGGPAMVFQPIWTLRNRRPIAYEALAQFPHLDQPRTAEQWFAEAAEVGLGDFEVAATRAGLAAQRWLPVSTAISVNVSAANLRHPEMIRVLGQADPRRTIVHVIEHEQVESYGAVRAACGPLRALGCCIAVDGAGASADYPGFQRLVELHPDVITLDEGITRHLDTDPARAAMATALVGFGRAINATVLAKGVSTAAELDTATALGIDYAQGAQLGRPQPLSAADGPSRAGRGVSVPQQRRGIDLWM